MKVGFIFECGPQGADIQVCEYLAAQVLPGIIPVSRTLDNKDDLLKTAGGVAAALLQDGCECILIVWDLRPSWPDKRSKPCRKTEREQILNSLHNAGIADAPIYLICVEQELESWLLADERKLSAFLSTDAHPYLVKQVRHPDRTPNPKSVLMNHFKVRSKQYVDRTHAIQILKTGEIDLKRLRRSPTFVRFEAKLMELLP